MFYDIASFPWWLLTVALIGVLVGWITYADIPRGGWFEGWVKWAAIAFVIGLVVAVLKLLPGEAGLWLEIALLVMFLYIVGCFLGGWLKSLWPKPARPRAEDAAHDVVTPDASAPVEADALTAQAEQERLAAEAAVKAEAERQAAAAQAEQDRLAAEAAAKVEAERQAAAAQAEQERLAAEAAAKVEAERQAAAAQAEQDRLAAEAAAKVEAERQAAAAQAEQERLAAEAAAKAEAERQAAAAQAEQERLAAEAAAKAEAERQAAAAQAEQDRLAAEAASKAEAERQAVETGAEQDRLEGDRPPALAAPRGASDDLKLIRGIGPNNERILNGLGVYHFGQIAAWSPDHAAWIGHEMRFPGRIGHESWIPQAKLLAAGLDTDHSAAVKSGVVIIDDSADMPMSEAEAASLAAGMPALIPTVEGEERHAGTRPLGLAAPRGGSSDDLKLIKGVGKQNEGRLRRLGIWHFDQVAAWSPDNVKWVSSYLAFSGRIDRERWIAQARDLVAGRTGDVARDVEAGLVATSRDDSSDGQGDVENVQPKGG
jgi:predicted flap endonuclease-1-like 5' DNA nuclease